MPDAPFSFQDGLGAAPDGASAPVSAAAASAAPQTFSFADASKPVTPQFGFVAPRLVTPQEGGDGILATNLSPADYARFRQGLGPAAPAQTAATSTTPPPAQAPPQQPPMTGAVANFGAGANDAIAGTLGLPVDAATGAINLASRGVNAVFGTHLGQISNPLGGSNSIKTAMGVIGADPRNVQPADQVEQIARGAGGGVASAVLPWSVARALPVAGGLLGAAQRTFGAGSAGAQAGAGAVAGASGQVAADNAPAPLQPLAGTVGAMVGGGAALGATAGVKALLGGGAATAGHLLAPLTTAGQQRMAGAQIAAASSDPAALRQTLANPPELLVPGSMPTTFQATGGADAGLGQLERATATRSPAPFMQRQADQNTARVNALQGLAPADASPEAVGQAFRQQLAAIDAQGASAENAARGQVQQAVGAMGGAVPAGADQQATRLQQYGQQFRGQVPDPEAGTPGSGLAAANAAAGMREGQLWRTIDPDGTLRVNMAPVRQSATELTQAMPGNAAPMTGEPKAIFDTAASQPDTQPFSELTALRGRITDAMRTEMQQNGRSQTWGRMSQLLKGVDGSLEAGVRNKAVMDRAAVAAGAMQPEDAIMSRVGNLSGGTAGASPQNAGRAYGGDRSRLGAGATNVSAGQGRAGSAAGGGFGSAAGSARLPKAVSPQSPSLLTFLIRRGGLQDYGGNLKAMNAEKARIGLVRGEGRGVPLDYAREAATEAGYLPQDSDINTLLDAIEREIRGNKVYPEHEAADIEAANWARQDADAHERALADGRARVASVAGLMGGRLSPAETEHAAELVASGMHPQDAVEEAAAASDNHEQELEAARRSVTPGGVPAGATQSRMPFASGDGAGANLDADALRRYQAAKQATADRHATYTNAPGVGQVLAPGRTASECRLGASQVPATLFPAGPGAAERAQAFVKAGGNIYDATDYLAFDLRRAAENPDGTLDAAKYQRWMKSRAETFGALPGTEDRFATAGKAQAALDNATAQRVEARTLYEKSAAGQFLGEADPVARVGRILRSDTGRPTMQQLARLTQADPVARAGLQRAAVEFMLRDLRGNASFSEGMPTALKADVFQTFMKKSAPALGPIFTTEQMASMEAVAADLQQAARSVSSTKLQGGSNTPQDLHGAVAHGAGHQSVLTQVVIAEALGDVAEHVAGPLGKAAGVASLVVNAMRQAGLTKVDQLVEQAMLHPEIARTLLSKVPSHGAPAQMVGMILRQQLRAATMTSAVSGQRQQPAPPPPAPSMAVTSRDVPPVAAWAAHTPFSLPGLPR